MLSILIIDDSSLDAEILSKFLTYNDVDAEFLRIDSADELHAALQQRVWDIIFCDYHIHPNFTCHNALSIIYAYNATREASGTYPVPVVVVSSVINDGKVVQLMSEGASDFIIKGYFDRLLPVLRRELRHTERARHYEELLAQRG
jgi:CheY-like chemotaxis protein